MKLTDYIRGHRRGSGAHRTELEAMRDPLLGDALEGYDKVQGDHISTLRRLEARIAERTRTATRKPAPLAAGLKRRRLRRWSIAAAAAVMVCAIGVSVLLLQREPIGTAVTGTSSEALVAQEVVLEPRKIGMTGAVTDEVAESLGQKKVREPEPDTAVEPIAEKSVIVPKTPASSVSNALAGSVPKVVQDETPDRELNDVTVVGYGTQKKSNLTGAITPVSENLHAEKPAAPQTAFALAGNAPSEGAVLDEVVVTGMGAQRKVTVTGAVTKEIVEELQPQASLKNAMAGSRGGGMNERIAATGSKDGSFDGAEPDDKVVVTASDVQRRLSITGAVVPVKKALADTTGITAAFKRYMAVETANSGIEGSATLEFEINGRGRPYRIKTIETTSKEAGREAVRLLRNGPGWEQTESRKRIVITF